MQEKTEKNHKLKKLKPLRGEKSNYYLMLAVFVTDNYLEAQVTYSPATQENWSKKARVCTAGQRNPGSATAAACFTGCYVVRSALECTCV